MAQRNYNELVKNTDLQSQNDKKYGQYMRDTYLANMNMAKERARDDVLKEKENERRKMQMI